MGISGRQKALMYALGKLARGGATRGGYTSMRPYISIGGTPIPGGSAGRVLVADLTIRDILDETPNTCQMTVMGMTPQPGAELVITLGSINSGTRLFGGKILSTVQGYLTGNPANVYHQVNGIDYTWLLGEHLVLTQYTNQTVAFIATDLIQSFAEGITATHIAADAGAIVIDSISFTNVALQDALTQLCSRAGAYWNIDYFKDLHLFEQEPPARAPDPTPLTPAHPTLLQWTTQQDLSQVVTRVFVEGGGGTVLAALAPGETILPMDTVGWYPGRGTVAAGTQRLTYTSLAQTDGVGSVIGPGVMPTTALIGTPTLGAGVTPGVHDYAVSFVTAAGESLAGPRTTVNVTGLLAPPPTALTLTPTPGAGVTPGAHDYAVSFVTAGGESLAGPRATVNVPPLAPPPTALTCTAHPGGPGPEAGGHYYWSTFVTAGGETGVSPFQGYVQPTIAAGTVPIAISDAFDGSGYTVPGLTVGDLLVMSYTYTADATDRVAPFPANGETPPGPASAGYTVKQAPGRTGFMNFTFLVPFSPDANVKFIHVWWSVNSQPVFYVAVVNGGHANITNQGSGFYTAQYFISSLYTAQHLGASNPIVGGVQLSGLPTGPAGVTARKLYRSTAGTTAPTRLLATIGDNTTTTYLDTVSDATLGAAAPDVGTATATQIAVSAIPVGVAGVTARTLYRTVANGPLLQRLATLGDNTTTTYTDALADASLGPTAPTVGTAPAAQVALSALPVAGATAAVTGRRVYRTAAGGTLLKVLATIGDNTTTTYTDALADASLGATAPAGDTSGLQQPTGTVLAGSPTLLLAGVSPAFLPSGGWAIIGNGEILVRYTGISGNSLTGIPPTGVGSISTSLSYGAIATAAPALLGVPASGPGSIQYALQTGDDINLLMTCDDPAAQAALAALIGGTGIKEAYIQDRRISYTEAVARGQAELAARSTVLVEVHYVCRDPLTRSGATIACSLPAPTTFSGTFKIQDVTISAFSAVPGQPPTYTVMASSQRYSLDDLLRMARGTVGA